MHLQLPTLPSLSTEAVLDEAHGLLASGRYLEAFRILGPGLDGELKRAECEGAAADFVDLVRKHAVFALCHEDPYTRRAFEKPRGYAGDAVMLDFIYSGVPPGDTTPTGRGVFSATTRVPTALSVRFRRSLLRSYIDETVVTCPRFRILSVASGHCREVDGSLLGQFVGNGELVALDQDPESCQRVEHDYASVGVRSVNRPIKAVLAGDLGHFDLIYSAGLFDYLVDSVARALVARLVSMLRPGGRLVVANYVPGFSGRAYLEAIMDWKLVQRDAAGLRQLFGARSEGVETFIDPHDNVVYGTFRNRGTAWEGWAGATS